MVRASCSANSRWNDSSSDGGEHAVRESSRGPTAPPRALVERGLDPDHLVGEPLQQASVPLTVARLEVQPQLDESAARRSQTS